MPYFAIVGFDAERSNETRDRYRPAHAAALSTLKEQGRLLVAGPMLKTTANENYTGSILVIDFPNQAGAEAWFKAEPFNQAGVYQSYTIFPYLDAMPIL